MIGWLIDWFWVAELLEVDLRLFQTNVDACHPEDLSMLSVGLHGDWKWAENVEQQLYSSTGPAPDDESFG